MWAGDGRICIWTSFTVQKSATSEDCRQPSSTNTSKTSWKPYTDTCVFFIKLLTYFDSKASTETYSKSQNRHRGRGLPSVFCSPKAVSKGGPNKPVVSSETGVCWLLRQKKQDNTEETVSSYFSKQLQLQQSECIVSLHLTSSEQAAALLSAQIFPTILQMCHFQSVAGA